MGRLFGTKCWIKGFEIFERLFSHRIEGSVLPRDSRIGMITAKVIRVL
jgi:hypothetical protein